MKNFVPFENDTQSVTVGPDNGLTFENGQQEINVYGDFKIDKTSGKEEIENIITILTKIKDALGKKEK